jgi:hypothetical protein
MRFTTALIHSVFAALCVFAQGQSTPTNEIQGIPPRATPADYQAAAVAGTVTVAAEFVGHAVPTSQGPLSTEDYVVVETGLFGPPEARLKLTHEDFSLRINGKKVVLPSQPYGMVLSSLKDPEWIPPDSGSTKSKTSFGTGGKGGDSGSTPAPVHVPIELQRAMAQRIQKASLLEGDRALPQAGLIFFQYKGKTEKITSIELIYNGPAGKATLALH